MYIFGFISELIMSIYRKLGGVMVLVVVILPILLIMIGVATNSIAYIGVVALAMQSAEQAARSYMVQIPIGTSTLDCWASAFGLYRDIEIVVGAVATNLGSMIASWVVIWIYQLVKSMIGKTKE